MKRHKLINILMLALTIHIFAVNAKLLYHMNPDNTDKEQFSFMDINEQTVLAMVFSLSYSLATVSALRISKSKILIGAFIFLDPIAVLLYYFIDIPLQAGAVYYAVYTGALIYTFMQFSEPEYLVDQIMEMKKKGISQRDIARTLNISESKVSRVNKRVNG